MPDQNPEPSQPGKPSETPTENPPMQPDTDRPARTEPETQPPGPDIDQPAPGTDPNPTPISPIGVGIVAPPD